SSRSTKLVHGGVRYLARGEIGLVREALLERGVLLRNAPHLVHSRAFLVPAYGFWTKPYYGLGLKLYDALAGRLGIHPTRLVDRKTALELVPTLQQERLRGGVVYHDGQFDDSRLAISLARTTISRGGTVLNHAPVVGLIREQGRVGGVRARDEETGEEYEIRARVVVNAAGVFGDSVRRMDDPDTSPRLRPSRGTHIVLDRSFLPGETAILVPKTDDGRVVFAIPWEGHTLIGTTDTPCEEIPFEPQPSADEVTYLLDYAGRYLTRTPARSDILSAFAGLRPLIGDGENSTAGLSREYLLEVSAGGLVSILGGKWTTYRRMASAAIDRAAKVGGLPARPCVTENLPLSGHPGDGPRTDGPLSLHGSDAEAIERLIADRPELGKPLHPRLPYLAAEIVWSTQNEWPRTLEDLLARRLRALFLDARAASEMADVVARLMAETLNLDPSWADEQVRQFQALTRSYLPA
ncbi:MAG TPA: glycerol-3-phosphate dehydrogenase/oxidase, partial [Isosphaeraceae bacterium]|nr:glycerol-3-phosphate dehydrogenase/oxidase [Isosphaeraceae bacterium]